MTIHAIRTSLTAALRFCDEAEAHQRNGEVRKTQTALSWVAREARQAHEIAAEMGIEGEGRTGEKEGGSK